MFTSRDHVKNGVAAPLQEPIGTVEVKMLISWVGGWLVAYLSEPMFIILLIVNHINVCPIHTLHAPLSRFDPYRGGPVYTCKRMD